MKRISFTSIIQRLAPVKRFLQKVWVSYRALTLWLQILIGVVCIVALLALGSFLSNLGGAEAADTSIPSVTLAAVSELSGNGSSVGVIGSVRSITEASILAQSGGTVTSVHSQLGSSVPAGYVLAELDNASQRASVLQAEGAYDGAIAARSGASPTDIAASARNTYTSSYNSLDSVLKGSVDTFFGSPGALGPQFLIGPTPFDAYYFPQKRAALAQAMTTWQSHLASAGSTDPQVLLQEADSVTRQANALVSDIATAATRYGSDANSSQLTALSAARSSISSLQAGITAAKLANQSQGTSATAGADANVKSALGALRAAQANLEKTLVRAPIGGTVNFLPIRVGDYVSPLTHVATVAQNGALEIVAYLSEENRSLLSVGTKVKVEDQYAGVVTAIAPALDPVTKQIEMHVAVTGDTTLLNGQSVHVSLPGAPAVQTATSTGPLLLPLTSLKLTPSARVVFSLGEDGKLVAHPVTIGDVRGDRIEITSPLPGDLRIVTDARGLSEGEKVKLITTTP